MSELDPSLSSGGPYVPTTQTSRLAIFSFLSSLVCLPGISGVLGVLLGALALRQIQSTNTITGSNLALTGILGGIMNLIVWGGVAQHYADVQKHIDEPTAAFMAAYLKSEVDGEAAAAPGLRPLMRHGEGELIRKALVERFGGFKELGPRSKFDYKFDIKGEHIGTTYALVFNNGAPCTGHFEYATNEKELRVVGFEFTSPVLRDLTINGKSGLHGQSTPDLGDFSGGSNSDPASKLKSFH